MSKLVYNTTPNIIKYLSCKEDIVFLCGPAGTGKTRASLEKIHLAAEKYAGSRHLLTRSTRSALTESALVTWEKEVVPAGHPILRNVQRAYRHSYIYPNGSEVVVCGLDDTQKIMSTQFDIIYVMEAIETELAQIEDLLTRIRHGVVPYNQIIGDTNPWTPFHWIYQLAQAGKIVLINTTHEDNPLLFEQAPENITETDEKWNYRSNDGRIGRWTEFGLKYISKLEKLTGPKYSRLRLGLWVGAEGAVYEDFDITKHCYAHFIPHDAQRYWSVDFGYNDPFVWQCWAVVDDVMYLEYEYYKTQTLVNDAIKEILYHLGWEKIDGELVAIVDDPCPLPDSCVCDWDAEGRAILEIETGFTWIPACKSILDGIQAVAKRLKVSSNGKPRIMFSRNASITTDSSLKDELKPTGLLEEITSYIWDIKADKNKKGEKPKDKNNHSMDAMRYMVCFIDEITTKERKGSSVPRYLSDSDSIESMIIVKRNEDEALTRFDLGIGRIAIGQ